MTQGDADRIRLLVERDRLEEAAALAEATDRHAEASRLWERACHFGAAARAALRGGDAGRALLLGVRAGDPELEAAAVQALAADPVRARSAAAELELIREHAALGRLLLALSDFEGAARAFENAGHHAAAGDAHERAERWHAARAAYQTALLSNPDDAAVRLRLGRLLSRARDDAPAIRVLQPIPAGAPERATAAALLRGAFERLGMAEAAARTGAPAAAQPAPLIESDSLVFGRYAELRHVTTTATARLFEAIDRLTGERVALKVLRLSDLSGVGRDAAARLAREAQALAALKHPHIVPLIAFLPDVPALVLKWMSGGSLADLLASGPISPARAADVATAVSSALVEAHRRGILHRDIKPSNVLFDASGRPHLADFGVAHVGALADTVTGGVFGTLGYLAPEVRAGGPASPASDVYAVGALLWQALTGGPPAAKQPFRSPELTADHERVAARLVAAIDERPASAAEARELLASLRWPETAPRAPLSAELPGAAGDVRLTPLDGARYHDRWLDRVLYVLPATEPTLRRARAFARAAHACLPVVFAHVERDRSVWIEAPPNDCLRARLGVRDVELLARALRALHAQGVAHGAVDVEHVYTETSPRLAFPLEPRHDSPERDLADLERLAGIGSVAALPPGGRQR